MSENKKHKITYAFDPFCPWCYAMSNVVKKIANEFEEDFEFRPLSGGMILDDNVGTIKEKFPFLESTVDKVEAYTGIKFGPQFRNNILKPGEYEINSLEPSLAIRVFKTLDESNQALDFIHSLQDAFYFDGQDIRNIDVILEIVNKYNIDTLNFRQRFFDEIFIGVTLAEFEILKKWGINGYPTILYKKDKQMYLISSGYQFYIDLKNIMNQIKSQG